MKDKRLATMKETWLYIIVVVSIGVGFGFLFLIGAMGGIMYIWDTTTNLPLMIGMCFAFLCIGLIGAICLFILNHISIKKYPSKYKGWDMPRHKTWEYMNK